MTIESMNVEEHSAQVTKSSRMGLLAVTFIMMSVVSMLVMVVSDRLHDAASLATTLFTYLALFAKCVETKALLKIVKGLTARAINKEQQG